MYARYVLRKPQKLVARLDRDRGGEHVRSERATRNRRAELFRAV